MPFVLCFDTETTGLPDWKAPFDAPHQPYCLELGWLFSPSGTLDAPASQGHLYVDNGEITITPEAAAVNNLTISFLRDAGVGPNAVLNLWFQLASKADVLLGHNVKFDLDILEIMAYRANKVDTFKSLVANKSIVCTKALGRPFLEPKMGRRWHLTDLHNHFLGHHVEGAHAALNDVLATWHIWHAIRKWEANQVAAAGPPI